MFTTTPLPLSLHYIPTPVPPTTTRRRHARDILRRDYLGPEPCLSENECRFTAGYNYFLIVDPAFSLSPVSQLVFYSITSRITNKGRVHHGYMESAAMVS